jgi:hypothetical protein
MITIRDVIRKWLNHFDDKPTFLSNSSSILLSQIEENLKIGRSFNFGKRITDLVNICAHSNRIESQTW